MDEKEIRWKLWAAHPCFGKYGDDGELQCNRLPPIDFKMDSFRDISAGITEHIRQDAIKEVGKRIATNYTRISMTDLSVSYVVPATEVDILKEGWLPDES